MSYETVMTAAKIIATAHPIARGVCKCDTPADVSFKDVASTLLDSGWESVLIADKKSADCEHRCRKKRLRECSSQEQVHDLSTANRQARNPQKSHRSVGVK